MSNTNIDYWLCQNNCHHISHYNYKLDKKNHTIRAGLVKYKGELLWGTKKEFTTREFKYYEGHSWLETKDGNIVDWVINETLQRSDKKIWTKKEIEDLGFEYIYYDNEKPILNKLKKQFQNSGDMDRKIYGGLKMSHWDN
jgi:hypothetical protein